MIPLREQEYVRQRFEREIRGKVKIDYFTQKASLLYLPGREECAYCEQTHQMLEELASLSDKITLKVHEFTDAPEEAKKLGVNKVPGIAVRGAANRVLRFFGIPGGNEFVNFVETLIEASVQKVTVDEKAAKHLKRLREKVSIEVYVTPSCPHSPGVVRAAHRLALASARVEAAAVEITEFPRLAQHLGVSAVPLTVIDGRPAISGAVDEVALAEQAVKAAESGALGGPPIQGGPTSEVAPAPGQPQSSGLVLPG